METKPMANDESELWTVLADMKAGGPVANYWRIKLEPLIARLEAPTAPLPTSAIIEQLWNKYATEGWSGNAVCAGEDFKDELKRIAIAASEKPCPKCGQKDIGQYGEYPCPECGLPTMWGSSAIPAPAPALEELRKLSDASDDPEEMLEACAEIADLMDSDHTKAVSRLREIFEAARTKALREAAVIAAEKCLLRSADEKPSAEQPTRHFSAKQIQDVFESYWSGTSSMSTKAAQFVADKLNTLLDAPAEQRLRELVAELQKLQAGWYKDHARMTSNQGWQNGVDYARGHCADELDVLVKKYGERG